MPAIQHGQLLDHSSRTSDPRGHLVPANHLDDSEQARRDSFDLTNMLPQTATFNRGAWLATEELIECYRGLDELLVIGGVVWGNNAANDYFLASHGIKTPDRFWKAVIRGDGTTIAWLIRWPRDSPTQPPQRDLRRLGCVGERGLRRFLSPEHA